MRQIIALSICFLMSGFIYAQEDAKFTVTVSTDSVLLGNYLEVTFILENAEMEEFQAPVFEGFRIISGPNQASSFSMINGKVTQTASYSYYLEPKDIGNYYIAPAFVTTTERTLETAPIEILVAPNPDGIIQNTQPKKDAFGGDFFGRNDFFSRDFYNREDLNNSTPPKPIKKPKKKRKTYKL